MAFLKPSSEVTKHPPHCPVLAEAVTEVPRFKEKGQRPHHSREKCQSYIVKRAYLMGYIMAAVFGK